MQKKLLSLVIVFLFVTLFILPEIIDADENIYEQRIALYKKTEAITHMPWYYIAAFDQYERNKQVNNDEVIASEIVDELWYGPGNFAANQHINVIQLFNGMGKDGNGDGRANPENPDDMLYTIASLLQMNGQTKDDIKISLWDYYQRDLSVKAIMSTAKVYKHFNTIELTERAFPVSRKHRYSYQNNWGNRRGFGGNRIHEGTDIFASYGTPIQSTTYGVIELKGWNLYGGWRIGIRDIHNIYHYYAHLNNYNEDFKVGDVVKPGDILGTVGSSGYGPEGTSGKFPPHLHYGMYKDNGKNEWSFDPYPYLKKWERMK